MYEFNYHRPASLSEARKILASASEATILAGGMTLLPTMKMRLAQPSDLVDLGEIDELRGICDTGGAISIGAMVCHADVAACDIVKSGIPALAELAAMIGDPQVRNRGTLGGSVSNNDPAADYPAAVLGLNATIVTDQREIVADDFFLGLFETSLHQQEILQSIRFPKTNRAAYVKFPNPASRYAVVGVMVADTDKGVRVAVTGAGACVFRHAAFENALNKDFCCAALEGLSLDSGELNGDLHASPEYRAHLVSVMAKRAVASLGG